MPTGLDKYGLQLPPREFVRDIDTKIPWDLEIGQRYSLKPGDIVGLQDETEIEYWGVLDNNYVICIESNEINGPRLVGRVVLNTLVNDIGVREVIGPDDTVLYPIGAIEELPTEEP
jgi:hypothetical protein